MNTGIVKVNILVFLLIVYQDIGLGYINDIVNLMIIIIIVVMIILKIIKAKTKRKYI